MADKSLAYPVPTSLSLARLKRALDDFLREKSGRLRSLAVTTALMRVVGRGFSLFDRVEAQGVNEADAASGALGDVRCYAADICGFFAIEVKDRRINLQDVQASIKKAQDSKERFERLLFIAPKAEVGDRRGIDEAIERARAGGLEVHQVELIDLVTSNFVLLDETWRPQLLIEIGKELDSRGELAHRRAWQGILAGIAASDQP